MQVPRKRRHMREILKEFQRIDQIYFEFEHDFLSILHHIILDYFPDVLIETTHENELKHFANQIFNAAESVIDKDQNYSEARIKEELINVYQMNKLKDSNEYCPNFIININKNIKQLTVEYFNGIYELSGNGFRLLELNINYCVYVFADWLCQQVDNEN